FVVYVAKDGRLSQLGDRALEPEEYNLWLHEAGGDTWRVQVNLESGDRSRWVYRRDARIARPMREVVIGGETLRYVNPAVQLLWKAAHVQPKDDADLAAVLPRLAHEEREWLTGAIALAHPASPWNRVELL